MTTSRFITSALCVFAILAAVAVAGEESNWERFKHGAKEAGSAAWDGTKNVAESVAEGAQKAGDAVARGAKKTGEAVAEGYEEAKDYVKEKTSDDQPVQPVYQTQQVPPGHYAPETQEALDPLTPVEAAP